jgi:hypothetical protein
MKKNTYILAGVFVCLFIIAYLLLQQPGEQSSNSGSIGLLCSIDSLQVDKIEIKTPASSVTLEKRGAGWFVAQPLTAKADSTMVGQIIHQIKIIEMKSIVSSKPEKHSVFQVDQTGTHVTIYEKGVEKAAFILGKMATNYTESYARQGTSNDVLLVEGASGYMFNRPVKDWRDKTILTASKENMKEVQYQYGDTSFTVALHDSAWFVGKDKAQQAVMDGIIASLSHLQADDFIDTTVAPKITALVISAGTQLRFSFNKTQNTYAVQSSGSPQWFVMESGKANQILKRKKEIVETRDQEK